MNIHSFHIPVLGLAFSIDTPIKVAHLGIDSVMSIVEDSLLEEVRKFYAEKLGLVFIPIKKSVIDFRAKRITAYLNFVKKLVDEKFERFRTSCSLKEAVDYFSLLPEGLSIRNGFFKLNALGNLADILAYARKYAKKGSIDVNIMTKVDRVNYKGANPLPKEYNDAHAALRGFANSDLNASLVLSAGLNPSLYSYMASFEYENINYPHYLRPNTNPWTSVAPTILFHKNKPWIVLGTPGSDRIPTVIAQFISSIIDSGMSAQEAMDRPRIHCSVDGLVSIEKDRFDDRVIPYLAELGYKIDLKDPYSYFHGAIHAVIKKQNSTGFQGIAEIRRDGIAEGVN